jgi:hypothetical protein
MCLIVVTYLYATKLCPAVVAILESQSTREKKADLLKKKKKNMKGTFYQFTLSSTQK